MLTITDTVPTPVLVPVHSLGTSDSFKRVSDGKHYILMQVADPQPCFCAEDSLGAYVPGAELVYARAGSITFSPA